MKNLTLAATIPALLIASSVYAQDIQHEITFEQNLHDDENEFFSDDQRDYSLEYKLHFKPLDTSKGPIAEAEFLNQSSFAYGKFGQFFPFQSKLFDTPEQKDSIELGTRFVDPQSGIIVGGSYYTSTYEDFIGFNDDDFELDQWAVEAGAYLSENLAITGVFKHFDADGDDYHGYGVKAKSVLPMSGEAALALEGNLTWYDLQEDGLDNEITELQAGATYYFNRQFGLGGKFEMLELDDGDEQETNGIILTASYNPTEMIGLEASLGFGETESDLGDDEDSNSFGVKASFRF